MIAASAGQPARGELKREQDLATAETLRIVAQMLEGLADALTDDDGIMGSISGQGLANHLPALPKHVRDVLTEYLTDEAARSYRADLAYLSSTKGTGSFACSP